MDRTKKIWEKAKRTATNKDAMKETFAQAGNKLKNLATNSSELRELKSKLEVLLRMFRSHINGQYKAFPTSTIVLIVFALAYFVTPTDLIPDFIPALGFADDASVVFLIVKKLSRDIDRFHQWEVDHVEQAD